MTIRPFTYNVNTKAFTQLGLSSEGYSVEANAINGNGWLAGQAGPTVLTAYTWNGSL